jgi:hypothetical protein
MTIILGDDSLNKTFFSLKNKMSDNCFFFKLIIFNWSSRCTYKIITSKFASAPAQWLFEP